VVRKATVQVMDCGFLVGDSGCLPVKQAVTGDYYNLTLRLLPVLQVEQVNLIRPDPDL
jgi:hypothetical protein